VVCIFIFLIRISFFFFGLTFFLNSLKRSFNFLPNVVKLVGYSLTPQKYIITKLYETDLLSFLIQNKLPMDLIFSIAIDIVSGMNAIHKAGVIHRDLKSSNILLENMSSRSNCQGLFYFIFIIIII